MLSKAEQSAQVAAWWQALSAKERLSLRQCSASRRLVVVGRFVEPCDDEPGRKEPSDYYEYLVNHEIYLDDGRKFFICSAHPAARNAVARGRIAARFICPREDAACPMRRLLSHATGKDLRLSLETAPP